MMFNEEFNALKLLQRLVLIETPSGDVAKSKEITALLKSELQALGGCVTLHETEYGFNLVADFTGNGSPLLLLGHTDTVWPVGTLAADLPLRVTKKKFRGPGAYDMKAGIVVMLAAIARSDPTRRRALKVVLVCDEEIGSPTSRELLKTHAKECAAVLGFESPHPDGSFKVGRNGSTRLRITVSGKAAHAALDPENGVNAIEELMHQLAALQEIVASEIADPPLLNIGTVSGGGRTNVVPEDAWAEVGLRFFTHASEARVLQHIAELQPQAAGAQIEVETLSYRPTWQADATDLELLAQVADAQIELGQLSTAQAAQAGSPAAGAGDTNLTGALGIPSCDGFGPAGGGAHALTEHIKLASFHARIELLSKLIAV